MAEDNHASHERSNLTSSNKFELLLYRLGSVPGSDAHELYGINVFKVREIITNREITPIAGAPDVVIGAIDNMSAPGIVFQEWRTLHQKNGVLSICIDADRAAPGVDILRPFLLQVRDEHHDQAVIRFPENVFGNRVLKRHRMRFCRRRREVVNHHAVAPIDRLNDGDVFSVRGKTCLARQRQGAENFCGWQLRRRATGMTCGRGQSRKPESMRHGFPVSRHHHTSRAARKARCDLKLPSEPAAMRIRKKGCSPRLFSVDGAGCSIHCAPAGIGIAGHRG